MQEVFRDAESKMKKTIDNIISQFNSIRAGRANPSVLDKVLVEYYGTETPINQLAAVSISGARTLVIEPWDIALLDEISKSIQKSDIGINPQNDGKVLRLTFPALTEDRRREIVKAVSKLTEDAKVSIRSVRRDFLDKLKKMKKDSSITEDELSVGEKKVQNLTDKFCDEIEKIAQKKEKEVMEI